ncbi:class I SAM-dependent methyltransferase [Bradyrhizobium sp. Cp5.3]|uniref:class I SAM-dependent methyltransferase n=1 Tax=Bradyrhizobium sp. Cp5.3 TaxID=443598 RepID=UPI0004180075|nr:class I SAM-dependent methyltransferase [Bradyrhizobium sp. Cp5.3]
MHATLVVEEGVGGNSHQLAYVAVDPDRLEAAKSRLYLAERERRVLQWRRAFDQVYSRGDEGFAPSFVGWTSNFTNKPIPELAMAEWLDCTVERIRGLGAKRVLEVGCGVGLLVERLAPGCTTYFGTDLSPVAVHRLRTFTASKADLCHVELLEREAADFDGLPSQSFDVVVLNSVVQYFPSIEYLQDVLERAVRVVAPGGHIFVGDVRHFGLLRTFHAAVQSVKAPPGAAERWLERKVSLSIAQERELVIDPRFFHATCRSIPRIAAAEGLRKRGSDNELTRYRYDVVLHVDHDDVPAFGRTDHLPLTSADPRETDHMATDPLAAAYRQQLGIELANALQAQFPDAHLPSAVVALSPRAFLELVQPPSLVPSLASDDCFSRERIEG